MQRHEVYLYFRDKSHTIYSSHDGYSCEDSEHFLNRTTCYAVVFRGYIWIMTWKGVLDIINLTGNLYPEMHELISALSFFLFFVLIDTEGVYPMHWLVFCTHFSSFESIRVIPAMIDPITAHALYAKQQKREKRLKCLSEWKDGSCARIIITAPNKATNTHKRIAPSGTSPR